MCAIARTGSARACQRPTKVKIMRQRARSFVYGPPHEPSDRSWLPVSVVTKLKSHESFWPKRFATPRFL